MSTRPATTPRSCASYSAPAPLSKWPRPPRFDMLTLALRHVLLASLVAARCRRESLAGRFGFRTRRFRWSNSIARLHGAHAGSGDRSDAEAVCGTRRLNRTCNRNRAAPSAARRRVLSFDRLGQDLIGGLGPDERDSAFVVALDEVLDRGDQFRDVVVYAAPDLLLGQDRETWSRGQAMASTPRVHR